MADTERASHSTQFKQSSSNAASKYGPGAIKILELIMAIVCIIVVDDPANNGRARTFLSPRTAALVYSTFSTFIIITGIYILGKLFRDNIQWKTSALISLVGIIMFIASAVALLNNWQNAKNTSTWTPNTQRLDLLGASSILSGITAFIFLLDLIFTVGMGFRGNLD